MQPQVKLQVGIVSIRVFLAWHPRIAHEEMQQCVLQRASSLGSQFLPLAGTGRGSKVIAAPLVRQVLADLLPWQAATVSATTTAMLT